MKGKIGNFLRKTSLDELPQLFNDMSLIGHQQMELYYVHNASAWLDIKILFKTVVSVLKREGSK